MTNKNFCLSSFFTFRYLIEDETDFFDDLKHSTYSLPTIDYKISNFKEMDIAIKEQLDKLQGKKIAIMLSGGIDSAILASYLPGCDAYTFRYLNGTFQKGELERAEYYAKKYGLNLHYVEIGWKQIDEVLDKVLKHKGAPVHSIEPQIYLAAEQAKKDGNEVVVIGEAADLLFGGLDSLLGKDWDFNDFIERFIYCDPSRVLKNPEIIRYPFEKYRLENNRIDFVSFLQTVDLKESITSYLNAFETAGVNCYMPYAHMRMSVPLDLNRIRNGEPKYIIRELFKVKYPDYPVPVKLPMPRPVDEYFKDWCGPKRSEFLEHLDLDKFTGNQKWQMYCAERFLDLFDKNNK